jgi:Ca2+-binding RTX toxin-like protein
MADIEGNDNANTLNGTRRDDDIRGRGGNDTVLGLGGDDRVRGDEGNDTLDGGAGRDRLRGDQGNDVLTGGADADRFIFGRRGGADVVTDYQDEVDRIDVSNFRFASFEDVLARAEQVGADVVITLADGVTATLQNTDIAVLDAGDFII